MPLQVDQIALRGRTTSQAGAGVARGRDGTAGTHCQSHPSSAAVDMGAVSPSEALKVVSSFFEHEWPATQEDEVQLEKMTNGWRNVYLVRRSTPSVREASAVVLRHTTGDFGGENDLLTLSQSEECVLAFELSRRGWGPKLFGLNGMFRVEEYIESRTLTSDDCKDPLICRDIARSYARFHSLDMPFTRSKFDLCMQRIAEVFVSLKNKEKETTAQLVASGYADAMGFADELFTMDYAAELDWIKSLAIKFDCKKTLMHFDANFLNILVRKDVDSECRIVIIDFDIMMHGYRGLDIGAHFVNRMIRWGGTVDKLSGSPFPTHEEQTEFCQFYRKELQELGHEMADSDSVDHLVTEGEVGAMLYTCFLPIALMRRLDRFDKNPVFLSGIHFLLTLYSKLKEQFIAKHHL